MSGKSILVSGGSGSFGNAFVRHLCATTDATIWRRIIVYSRDELKQSDMQRALTDERLRFFIGDIRDKDRLRLACRDVQVIVHASALKRIETMEQNPLEGVLTNVLGSANVVQVAVERDVERCLLLSTDKAVAAINAYGTQKACAEKLFLHANTYAGPAFSVTRWGNVAGSRGSVIPLFRECAAHGLPLPVTDPLATRFWITLAEAVRFVEHSLSMMTGSELFVPRMPSVRLGEMASVLASGRGIRVIGMRPAEKLHEVVIGAHEQVEGLPSPYASDTNEDWLEGDALREAVACV